MVYGYELMSKTKNLKIMYTSQESVFYADFGYVHFVQFKVVC